MLLGPARREQRDPNVRSDHDVDPTDILGVAERPAPFSLPSALEPALAGLVVTGVLMGMVNPMKLYARPAFFVKMIALAGAMRLSHGGVGPHAFEVRPRWELASLTPGTPARAA